MSKESIYVSFRSAYKVFPVRFKWRYWISLFFLFLNSVIELIGLAAILPLFSIMLKDNFVKENYYLLLVYNALRFESETQFIIFICAVVTGIIVFKNFLSILILRYQTSFSFSLYTYFSSALQKHFYALGYLNFKKHNSNFIVSYIHNYPAWFAQFFILPLLTLINEITVISMLLISVIFFNPQIVLLLLCTVLPASALVYMIVRKKISGAGRQKAEFGALLHKNLHQSIEGFVDIKTLGKENYFFEGYDRLVNENSKINVRSNVLMAIPSKVIETGMILGMIALLLAGIFFIKDKSQLVTLIGLFAIAAYRILPSVNRIMAAMLSMREYQYTVPVVAQIQPDTFKEDNSEKTEPGLKFEKNILLKEIGFRYVEENHALRNISIEVAKGETIGIIGRSGAGKTTLINILLRFLKENEGAILVDGVQLTDKNIRKWRSLIGYVQQQVYIIDGSIAENIAFGTPKDHIDKERMNYAVEAASLVDFVNSQADGLDTRLGERGSQISGGQRQRIGIARALYSKASILLFDEATSALDTDTETEITEAIKKLSSHHLTMIIVAHRYTTLRYCNKIVELENGSISNTLTYEQLKGQST